MGWSEKLTSWQEAIKVKFNVWNIIMWIYSRPRRRDTPVDTIHICLWSQQQRCHSCTNFEICSTGGLTIFVVALLSTHGRQTSKSNHIYSYGPNLFAAESVGEPLRKFQAWFNLNWLPGRRFFLSKFLVCVVSLHQPLSWYRWCPWYPLWPAPPAAETAALWCPSEQHGAVLRTCGRDRDRGEEQEGQETRRWEGL